MECNQQQSNSVNLSSFFHEVINPIEASALISNPQNFFYGKAYNDFLVQLGKFLSFIDSSLMINVDLLTNESPMFISYANSLNKSIKILRHSLSLLRLVLAVTKGRKKYVFLSGIDIINNAVGIIDETIILFFRDKVTSVLQEELSTNILRLYDQFSKNLPTKNSTTFAVNSKSVAVQSAQTIEKLSQPVKLLKFTQKPFEDVEDANTLSNQLSSVKNITDDSNSTLVPISCQNDIIFPDLNQKKVFDRACRDIKDELNYFAYVKSKKLRLMCLLCNESVRPKNAKNHITELEHLFKKSKVTSLSTTSNSVSSLNCDSAQNTSIEPESCVKALESNLSSKFAANSHQLIRESLNASLNLGNIGEPSNFFLKTDQLNFKPQFKPICYENQSLSKSVQKQFDDLCEVVGDEINNFSVNRSKSSLRLTCLLCTQIMPAVQVVKHVKQPDHFSNVPKKNDPRYIPGMLQLKILKLSKQDQKFLVYFPASQDFVCMLCRLVLAYEQDKWFKHFQNKCHKAKLQTFTAEDGIMSNSQNNFNINVSNCRETRNNFGDQNLINCDKVISVATTKDHDNSFTTLKQENIHMSYRVNMSQPKVLQFKQSSHEKEFLNLRKKVGDETDYFSFHVENTKLQMTCKLCKKCLPVSSVEAHVKEREHIQRVSNNKYLEFCPDDHAYCCTVCKIPIFYNNYFDEHLWLEHLESTAHHQKEQILSEYSSSSWNSTNNLSTNLSAETEFVYVSDGENCDLELKQHNHNNDPKLSLVSSENDIFSKTENDKNNEYCVPETWETIEPTIADQGGLSNSSSGLLVQEAIIRKIGEIEFYNSPQNKSDAITLREAENAPALPTSETLSDEKFNLEAFQFSKFSHSTQFISLIKQIYDEVAYFTLISLVEKEDLQLFCHPCKKLISSIYKAMEHVRKWSHFFKATKYNFCSTVLPAISRKHDWLFLEPRPMYENYYCSVCNTILSNEFPSWVEHFQSETHSSNLQTFIVSNPEYGLTAESSKLGTKNSFKVNSAIDHDISQEYVHIFAEIENPLESCSHEISSQNTFKSDPLELKNSFHLEEYTKFCDKVKSQYKHFSIQSEEHKNKIRLMCKLCNDNVLMTVEKAEWHTSCNEHLTNLMTPLMNKESKVFLGHSKTIYCTLCNVPLFEHQHLWLKHFESESHSLQLQKYHDKYWSSVMDPLTKFPAENKKFDEDCMESANFESQLNPLADSKPASSVIGENSATSLNAEVGSNAKSYCSVKNQESDNNFLKERIGSLNTDPSDTNISHGDASPVHMEELSHSIDLDSAQNYISLIEAVKGSSDSTLSQAKLNSSQFQQNSNESVYNKLYSQIGHQIQHFEIVDGPQKKLAVMCKLCDMRMDVGKAPYHICCNDHLKNLMAPFMDEESKMFLGLFETIYCTLCGVPLYKNQSVWLTHFLSEFHRLRLQKYHKIYRDSRADVFSTTSQKREKAELNYGDTVIFENKAVTMNPKIELLPKLSDATKKEKEHSLSSIQNGEKLPEAGSNSVTDLSVLPDPSKYIYDLTTLTFAHFVHSVQFMGLVQSINDQVNHFLFESHPESKCLKFICGLCNESFPTIKEATSHIETQKHKLNPRLLDSETLNTPAIKNCLWMFLRPCGVEKGFLCTFCMEKLCSKPDGLMDQFQSKSHSLKLEPLPTLSCLNSVMDSSFERNEISQANDKKCEGSLFTLNPHQNIEAFLPASSAQKNADNFTAERENVTAESCIPPWIPLSNVFHSESIQSSQKFDKQKMENLMTELGSQVKLFSIYSTAKGKIKLICKVCGKSIAFSTEADHFKSKDHHLNMVLPLMCQGSKVHLDWCDLTENYNCLLCRVTLCRGARLYEHFQSEAHLLKLRELSVGFTCLTQEPTADCLPTPVQSCFSIMTPTKNTNLIHFKRTLQLYRHKHIVSFLQIAWSIEDQVNFFSFKAGLKDLVAICKLCNVSFTNVKTATDHVIEEEHLINVEKNKIEATFAPWVPSVCDGNWKFIRPGLEKQQQNYFCILCNKVLSKQILEWVHHFLSESHKQKLKELHQDLLTIEISCLSDEEKDGEQILAPENLFQESFNVESSQFSSVAHEIQFETLAKKINYQINYFSVSAQQHSKELVLTCRICNKDVCVSEVEEHVSEQEHLLNLAMKIESKPEANVTEISEDDWQFLDFDTSSQEYMCTLCDVKLTSRQESWAKHFQNDLHQSKAKELQIIETSPMIEAPIDLQDLE